MVLIAIFLISLAMYLLLTPSNIIPKRSNARCHLEHEPNRFQQLKETHPKLYDYCMDGGEYNGDNIWQPSKDGLGMKHVMDFIDVKVD